MSSSNLKFLLSEYSQKRDLAIFKAREKKEAFYSEHPRLLEIDASLSKYAISTSKSLLASNDKKLIDDLNKKISKLKKEKETIYKQFNVKESDFNPKFSCKLCNDTGYISHNNKTELCKCLKQKLFDIEYNKYNVYNMQNNTFDKFDISYYSDKVNKSKYNSNISPRENMNQILEICHKFISNFDDPNEKNLLFIGNSGLGKTCWSNCIANELLKAGKTVLYQTSPVMIDSIINYRLRKIKWFIRYL